MALCDALRAQDHVSSIYGQIKLCVRMHACPFKKTSNSASAEGNHFAMTPQFVVIAWGEVKRPFEMRIFGRVSRYNLL